LTAPIVLCVLARLGQHGAGGLLTDTHPIARFEWRSAGAGLIVFLLGYFILLVGIDTPDHPYFDETHYVPAARQLLQTHFAVPTLNLEHPPLAKS
jgi:hypothetical protein